MRIINNFIWLVVTDKAKDIFTVGLFDLYILHDDNSKSLVEDFNQISIATENGTDIAIEVGHYD